MFDEEARIDELGGAPVVVTGVGPETEVFELRVAAVKRVQADVRVRSGSGNCRNRKSKHHRRSDDACCSYEHRDDASVHDQRLLMGLDRLR
jgi:hypothetical protein